MKLFMMIAATLLLPLPGAHAASAAFHGTYRSASFLHSVPGTLSVATFG